MAICKVLNLPAEGSKSKLTKRILDDCPSEDLLPILVSVDRLEWWRLLFLQAMLTTGASRKEILREQARHKSLQGNTPHFQFRPWELLGQEDEVPSPVRPGRQNSQRLEFQLFDKRGVTSTLAEHSLKPCRGKRVAEISQEPSSVQFLLKYHRPGASVQSPSIGLEARLDAVH